jgi:(1->4)-alpha-D-glucan 1-alpha-D-glucosylmutase
MPLATIVEPVTQLVAGWPDGRIKFYVTAQGLALRRRHPDLFLRGGYQPLDADDVGAEHVIALRRRHEGKEMLAVVPRLTRRLRPAGVALPLGASVWGTTRILLPAECASAQYLNLLTGERIAARNVGGTDALFVAEVLRHCPVALLWGVAS